MRALGLYEGGRFELEDIPVPKTPPGWGLIRTIASAAGLFQAQMAAGMLDTLGFPRILGHEIVGEVVGVSSDAAPQPGSVVVADAVVGCGVCEWCIRGDDMICPWMRHLGINIDGGFADYVAVPESHMFPIKPGTPVEEAVMLGSALPASVHAARRAGIRGGHRVVVTGVGSIGLTICQVARAMGATSVVAVDIAEDRLDAAAPWTDGAVNVSGVEPREAAQLVRETLGPPAGADIVFEAAGHIDSVDLGLHAVRRGGTVLLMGICEGRTSITFDSFLRDFLSREVSLITTFGFTRQDFVIGNRLHATGDLDLTALTGETITLEQVPAALAKIAASGTLGKRLVVDVAID
ncbi:MAG: alcohol dehydrogenase catalytic domain-containing protein [Acidimicrobiia bacterium]|nr:alcohol dehydrogenase catalytic domain-containing protein [Acidimicrobiia bacterium]MYC85152.1 alcohol dehydrogenase catalytic domain-containing protein [Acidimicrobiia bacterium]